MPIGPSRPLHLTKPESIDIRQAARYFGARGEADSATLALLERCAAPLLAAATPRAVWLEADVESLAQVGILKGEDIFRHLEGCREALLLAVTLGPGADSQIRRAGVGDIAAGVASDALGSALAEQAADAAEALGMAARRVSRKETPPAATQSIKVSPATRRMARLRLRRRSSARVRRRR